MAQITATFATLTSFSLIFMLLVIFMISNVASEHNYMFQRGGVGCEECCNQTKRLLIISFDGFRWNYLNRTETPNFHKFIHNGVHARHGLTNAFVTKTFPNHYTLATGMWEESHNIIANRMYDPVLNQTFSPKNQSAQSDPAWFDAGGEPIWVTNQLRGNGHSGVLMWVGNEAPVHNTLPTKSVSFSFDYKNETKIDTMIEWFKNDSRMTLGMTYFPQPDFFAHKFGPESEQITRMIGGLDKVVGYLLKRFEEENLLESTNIILTSDHGFASTPKRKAIHLDDIIDPSTRYVSVLTPVADIWPHEGFLDEIYENLTAAIAQGANFTVYKKEEIPEHFHYKDSRRIGPIIALAHEHYHFTAAEFGPYTEFGDHGYDNRLGDMHPFFLAMGPDFKSGFSVDTFHSVDVYPLMCHLLQIPPSPNNGSMEIVSTLLKSSSNTHFQVAQLMHVKYLVPIITISSLLLLSLTGGVIYSRFSKSKKPALSADDKEIADDEETLLFSLDPATVPLL